MYFMLWWMYALNAWNKQNNCPRSWHREKWTRQRCYLFSCNVTPLHVRSWRTKVRLLTWWSVMIPGAWWLSLPWHPLPFIVWCRTTTLLPLDRCKWNYFCFIIRPGCFKFLTESMTEEVPAITTNSNMAMCMATSECLFGSTSPKSQTQTLLIWWIISFVLLYHSNGFNKLKKTANLE